VLTPPNNRDTLSKPGPVVEPCHSRQMRVSTTSAGDASRIEADRLVIGHANHPASDELSWQFD